jgi:hypothetical protein
MQLFNNFSELKIAIGSGNISNSIEEMQSFIDQAIEDFAIPIFGIDFVEAVCLFSEVEEPEPLEKRALSLLRRSIGNLAYLLKSQDGGMIIDDSGFQRLDNGQTKSAYQWQMNDFRRQRENAGWNALRNLYVFCEKNITEVFIAENYEEAPERIQMKKIWIDTDLEFSRSVKIIGFQTWWELKEYMLQAQEQTLRPLLTSDLYDSLEVLRMNGDEAQEWELFEKARRVIATGAAFNAIPLHLFKFEKGGMIISEFITNKENSTQQLQATEFMNKIFTAVRENFDKAKKDLFEYLVAKAEDYPSFNEQVVIVMNQEKKTIEEMQASNTSSKIVRF